jgi:hypothetical protein
MCGSLHVSQSHGPYFALCKFSRTLQVGSRCQRNLSKLEPSFSVTDTATAYVYIPDVTFFPMLRGQNGIDASMTWSFFSCETVSSSHTLTASLHSLPLAPRCGTEQRSSTWGMRRHVTGYVKLKKCIFLGINNELSDLRLATGDPDVKTLG